MLAEHPLVSLFLPQGLGDAPKSPVQGSWDSHPRDWQFPLCC